jgi:hypothetical protein
LKETPSRNRGCKLSATGTVVGDAAIHAFFRRKTTLRRGAADVITRPSDPTEMSPSKIGQTIL